MDGGVCPAQVPANYLTVSCVPTDHLTHRLIYHLTFHSANQSLLPVA